MTLNRPYAHEEPAVRPPLHVPSTRTDGRSGDLPWTS